jgi:hypothetical protein
MMDRFENVSILFVRDYKMLMIIIYLLWRRLWLIDHKKLTRNYKQLFTIANLVNLYCKILIMINLPNQYIQEIFFGTIKPNPINRAIFKLLNYTNASK